MKRKLTDILAALIPLWFAGAYLIYKGILRRYAMPCPIRLFTGFYCPGCGGTRCAEALVHFDIPLALRQNALAVAAGVVVMLFWAESVFRLAGKKIKLVPASKWFYAVFAGTALVYIIARNLIPAIAPLPTGR